MMSTKNFSLFLAGIILTSYSVLMIAQTTTASNTLTRINPAQTNFSAVSSTLNVQEVNITVGAISTGLNMTLPSGGCKYMQVFLNGLKQTSGTNMDFSVAGGVVVFNNTTVKPGDLVSLSCFN